MQMVSILSYTIRTKHSLSDVIEQVIGDEMLCTSWWARVQTVGGSVPKSQDGNLAMHGSRYLTIIHPGADPRAVEFDRDCARGAVNRLLVLVVHGHENFTDMC